MSKLKEFIKISELTNWADNPRSIDDDKFQELKNRIKRHGQIKPVIVNSGKYIPTKGEVLGGNMRLKAFRELGIENIWVSLVDPKTEAEKIEIALTDNEELGYYNDTQLAELIKKYRQEIDLAKYAIHLDKPLSLDEILNEFNQKEIEEDEPPELDEGEPVSKLGEVYQLGRHRVMCGDSTKIEDVEKLMDGKKAAMVFTDPPYNVNYGETMKEALRYHILYDAISAIRPFVTGDVYICMSSSELHTLQKAFADCGGHFSTFIIWVKHHFTLGRANYQRQYEPILYGWFDGSSHYWSGVRNLGDVYKQDDAYIDELGQVWLRADNLSTDVWEIDRPMKSKEHPTMKPVKLCARGITNSCKKNDLVLDIFGGSGSTLIACEQTDRTCYMMELDPKYCDVIRKRYAKFIGKEDEWQEETTIVK